MPQIPEPNAGPDTDAAQAVRAARPKSAVSTGVGIAGLAAFFGWLMIARAYGMDGELSALTSVLVIAVAMVCWSVFVDKVHRNPTTGIDWALRRPWADVHAITPVKVAGLWATWAIIAFFYCVFRFYWGGSFLFALKWLGIAACMFVPLSIPYLLWIDRRLVEPRDGAWHFGQWLIGGDDYDTAQIWKHWRAWGVKAFFTVFMISIVPGGFKFLIFPAWQELLTNPVALTGFCITLLFVIDVHCATVGYILTMRPLDAHIRTANPYGMGWVAALICYPPFVLMNPGAPLFYGQGTAGFVASNNHDIDNGWIVWLEHWHAAPWMFWVWGALLVALTAIYAWATVAFGLRFSNLTHRGIITHGPYAYTRHPAYVAKNAFWWLSSLVFLPWDGSVVTAVRNVTILSLVSGVYYWRAKTEERHLLADPSYRAYWDWAQQNALIPRLCQRFTGMARPMVVLEPDERVGPVT